MYKTATFSFLLFSPLIFQSQTAATATPSSDPVMDILKLLLSVAAVLLTPIAVSKLNTLRNSIEEFRRTSSQNTQSVVTINQSMSQLTGRVAQLENDLANAVKERDAAKALVIATQTAADVAASYSSAQIKMLEERNTTLNADLITERVINAELAGNIRELRAEISKLKERCEMLESAGPIADAIARQLLEMNSKS